jgi:long-subunit fatty acid transport protein
MMRYITSLALIVCAFGALFAARVRADGETLMPGGAVAISRGGATAARPTDATAMLTNPAGLVDLTGPQLLLSFDTTVDNFCVHPYGYYGWGVYLSQDANGNPNNPDERRSEFGDPASSRYGDRHLDKVCDSGPVGPLPQFAFAMPITKDFAFAIGFVAPALTGSAQWGGKNGTIETDDGGRPTPTRYQFIRQEASFALNPTASAAYRPLPWLSLGLTLQVTMASASNYVVMAMRAGTSPANDAMAKLHAEDFFMPALTFAAYAKPTRFLQIAGTFLWQQGLDGHGDMTITTNNYHEGAVGSELLPLENDKVKLSRVRAALPWTATLAVRYVSPRGDAAKGGDFLSNERWDVELDAAYTANRAAGRNNHVEVANDFTLEFRRADGTPQQPLNVTQEDLSEVSVDRHVRDQVTLRLGGSWIAIAKRLQISAGGYFQTRGVDPDYASIDNFGFMRVGVGLGALWRVGHFDLMASYSHIFQETLTVAPPTHQPRTDASDDPDSGFDQRVYQDGQLSSEPRTDPGAPSPSKADGVAKLTQSAIFESPDVRRRVVNAGRYVASFDLVSIGATYHF